MTSAKTQLLGLLGNPVTHSRSPAIHTAALAMLGVDASYLAFQVQDGDLGQAVGGLEALGAVGANVTIPHKVAVMTHLDEIDPAAAAIGAVNTILREGDCWVGLNTDAPGLVRALDDAGCDLKGANVLVLGAGGAARAAVVGVANAGADHVTIASRRLQRGFALATELRQHAPVRALDLSNVSADHVDVLIQATSATMGPDAEAFAQALPLDQLPAHAFVMDLVYAPLETTVLRAARERRLRAVDGLGMLVHQAALALERWLGRDEPLGPEVIEAMRRAALS